MRQYKKVKREPNSDVTNIPWLLYMCSMPYFIAFINSIISFEILKFITSGTTFLWLVIASMWMSTGIENKNNESYSGYPMLFMSSLLIGFNVFTSAWIFASIIFIKSIILGAISVLGCWMWYGLDNHVEKVKDVKTRTTGEDTTDTLRNAEVYIQMMVNEQDNNEGDIYHLIGSIIKRSKEILEEVYNSPTNKYRKARRFLVIYLKDISTIVKTYNGLRYPDKATTERFEKILGNTNTFLKLQRTKLDSDDLFSLDVDMEVLGAMLDNHGG